VYKIPSLSPNPRDDMEGVLTCSKSKYLLSICPEPAAFLVRRSLMRGKDASELFGSVSCEYRALAQRVALRSTDRSAW